ncbi:hypothetical protein RI129_009625 [Pyrocoelia pectoralis]|uniref:Uncharacterized protein n=1 Tax=Pyrocoelia pectoralis TaxID=417401 RepID=A0AAN7ZJ45_9COLE
MPPKRKYDNSYIKFGFTSIESNGEIKPQCVICATVLANDALKPAKLKRHLQTVHPNFSERPPHFFQGKLENLKKMKLGPSVASFEISKLIAQSKKPHTIGETLVKPCLIKAIPIPLSNNTVKARIELMSNDIEEQLVSKIKISPFFALQCDESTDISNCCQNWQTTSKGIDVMNIITEYFQNYDIMWEKLAGFCTDGAPAMLGSRSGLATLIKQRNPSALTSHCILHRQALASKTLPKCLNNTMQLAIRVVNFIKATVLFHTEVRWLSKGNMLERLYELRGEVELFLGEKKIKDILEHFDCEPKLNFELNWINKILHGKYPTVLKSSEINKDMSIRWLKDGFLHSETEGFICAIQDGVIATNNYKRHIMNLEVSDKCRKCLSQNETIEHIIAGCSNLAPIDYLYRHNQVCKILHQQIAKNLKLINSIKPYYKYIPEPILETDSYILYWDRIIITDREVKCLVCNLAMSRPGSDPLEQGPDPLEQESDPLEQGSDPMNGSVLSVTGSSDQAPVQTDQALDLT